MQAALLPLRLRSARSGTAVMYLGDSHVSVTRGPDSDTPVSKTPLITRPHRHTENHPGTPTLLSVDVPPLRSAVTAVCEGEKCFVARRLQETQFITAAFFQSQYI